MDPQFSSYYPPRAQERWTPVELGSRMDRLGVWLRRVFERSPFGSQTILSLTGTEFLLCLFVPGYAYGRLRHRALGWGFFGVWWVAGLCVLVLLGRETVTGWALGAMTSCHASGIGYLLLREREASREQPVGLWTKVWLPTAVWFACAALIYWPGFRVFQDAVARPLRIPGEDRLIIVNSRTQAPAVTRNDLIAYQSDEFRLGAAGGLPVVVRGGWMIGRVIGTPGDKVEFGANRVLLNGRSQARQAWMPTSGGFRVEADQWFIWPTVDLRLVNNQQLSEDTVQEAFLRLARVPQENFVGRAFNRWFFHRQDIP
jgi:signal peptidase I